MKEILATVEPRAWALFRLGGATVLLLPLVLVKRERWPSRKVYRWLGLAAFLGVFLNQALFSLGLQRTTPEHSAVITTAVPVLTLLIAVAFRQERFRWSKICAIAVSLLGVLILLRVDEWGQSPATATSDGAEMWLGDLLTVCNVVSFAGFVVLMRWLAQSADGQLDPMGATVFCFVAGTLMMTGFSADQLSAENVTAVLDPAIWPKALFAIIGGTVLTYYLNNWALQHVNGSEVTLYIYVQPIVATCLSIARGHAQPEPRFFLAGAMIASGLLLESIAAARRRARRRARAQS